MTPTGTVSAPASSARRALWAIPLIPLVLGAVGWWWMESGAGSESDDVVVTASTPTVAAGAAPRKSGGGTGGPSRGPVPGVAVAAPALSPEAAEREAQRQLWEKRLARAKQTLESYMKATRYPPESRPASEHPDQMEMAEPERTRPLNMDGSDVQLRLKQDRVFVVSDEVVHFFVGCEDARRMPRSCEVVSASAQEADHMPGAGGVAAVPLAFTDDGVGGDALSGDGTYTGRFQPSKQRFPLYSGTLRVNVKVRSGSSEGSAFFDIMYTPSPPAAFTGRVREVLDHERGSLQLYLGIRVQKAGRYVVAGRVDDESGMPFAHVSFNEELQQGDQEVKLTIAGNLVRDEVPTFPLKLRDVEGFLLKEMGDPDRELMTSLRGYVHTTNDYPTSVFSSAEWQSEERQRYLDELTRDVNEALMELERFNDQDAPVPP
ncbi:choice-of-anchor X domain-containing protein [Myxococcus sp. Y35]|uniref:choice-of-anchor X domain-containing protein n=1 Tax=Pseudomyxococcus flavus TaxID=3115648 RepID=UPI003CF3633D